jgi:hypothetical protein
MEGGEHRFLVRSEPPITEIGGATYGALVATVLGDLLER